MQRLIYKSKLVLIALIVIQSALIILALIILYNDFLNNYIVLLLISIGFIIHTLVDLKLALNSKIVFLSKFNKEHTAFFKHNGIFRYDEYGFHSNERYIEWNGIQKIKIVAINPQAKFYQYLKINLFTQTQNLTFNIATPGIYTFYITLLKKFPDLNPKIEIELFGSTKHTFHYSVVKDNSEKT